ncbi:MAG: serine/threonine protein kinase [Bryobacterales bacterium]|nr:serine/threonine protein kinase [Bryobacterales bacterium]
MSLFHQAEEIFHAVLERPEQEREAFIERSTEGDTRLNRMVRALLRESHGSHEFFDERMRSVFLAAAGSQQSQREGEHIGPYRLERLIGAGGMGSVYLASRADGEFHQQVAIKVGHGNLASAWQHERLRLERQLLAKLKHENIAGLLDGGSTPTGHPYLVMEYINGEPLLADCERRGLTVRERLKIFLGVCEAVAFAHRNLVVHRDLKPANILVTADGVPKLLDFGISKLLDQQPAQEQPAATAMLAMTPAYASPEQIRGEAITTQSDVYSLGVLLYELLTGKSAFDTRNLSPAAVERLICETAAPKPSEAGNAGLAGDLDNIVGMAMRKEPERRYAGVVQLAEDIRRYLDHLPLTARSDEKLYRFRKFVRRHRVVVASAAAITVVFLAGLSVAGWYAARLARQVALIDRQFFHFRDVSRRLLVEFPNKLHNASSLAEVRQMYVAEALGYIDRLAADRPADISLIREIARAYMVVAEVQGYAYTSSMANAGDAIATYRKGIALLDPVKSKSPQVNMMLARIHCGIGKAIELSGDPSLRAEEIRRSYSDCLRYARSALAQRPPYLFLVARAHTWMGDLEWALGNREAALASYRSNIEAFRVAGGAYREDHAHLAVNVDIQQARIQAAAGDDWSAHASLQQAVRRARQRTTLEFRHAELAALVELARHSERLHQRFGKGPDPGDLRNQVRALAGELASPGKFLPEMRTVYEAAAKLSKLKNR